VQKFNNKWKKRQSNRKWFYKLFNMYSNHMHKYSKVIVFARSWLKYLFDYISSSLP